jgi:hypothetical protein
MSKRPVENDRPARYPICGSNAEFGYVPGPGRGGSGLRWQAGGLGVGGDMVTGFGAGMGLGEIGLFGAIPFGRGNWGHILGDIGLVVGLVLPVVLLLSYPALKRYLEARRRGGRGRNRSPPHGDV